MCLHTSICPSSASFSVVHTLPKCVCSDRKDTRPISKLICHTSICSSPATQDPYLHEYDTHMTNIYIDMTYIHVLIDCNTEPRSTSTPDLYLHRHDIHPYADRLESSVFHLGAPYISTSHQYICLSTSMYICDIYLQRHDIHPYADRRLKGVCHLEETYKREMYHVKRDLQMCLLGFFWVYICLFCRSLLTWYMSFTRSVVRTLARAFHIHTHTHIHTQMCCKETKNYLYVMDLCRSLALWRVLLLVLFT